MSGEEVLGKIKEIILETAKKHGVGVEKIILFGSRARGGYREGSDWDILVIVKNVMKDNDRTRLLYEVDRRLIELLDRPVDIVLVDREYYERKREYRGYVYHWATLEGVVLK